MRKTLILGGGWVGCRVAASSPSEYVATKRTQAGVDSLVQLGIQCVLFDAEKESTWEKVIECRNSFELNGIVITFQLTESIVAHLENLLKKLRCTGVPIVCVSTMSVFGPTHYLDIVTEEWPLEGISIRNEPLTERISAEKSLIVNHGACILHLSGICGNEDDDLPGGDRYIKNWIIKGYIKANWMLVNLIHIKDITAIVELALSAKLQDSFREQRFILSSGAYRRRDLFKAAGLPLPPHDLPFDNNGHPLDSVKKIKDYVFGKAS